MEDHNDIIEGHELVAEKIRLDLLLLQATSESFVETVFKHESRLATLCLYIKGICRRYRSKNDEKDEKDDDGEERPPQVFCQREDVGLGLAKDERTSGGPSQSSLVPQHISLEETPS